MPARGEHDEAYLDYYAEVCRRAGMHGLRVIVDFHQDVWSRMSGGCGAPGWSWEVAGIDFTQFAATGAAHVMQYAYDHRIGGRQAGYPPMSWGSNHYLAANGIIWTLFFAGEDFAPTAMVDGVNVGRFLRDHYLGAMRAVADRLVDMDHVIGFDTLNEPSTGYIGHGLTERPALALGPAWSPLDGLAAASGLTVEVPLHAPNQGQVGRRQFNEAGASIWLSGHEDPFRAAGAWNVNADGKPAATDPAFFQRRQGREVNFADDYMRPFFHQVASTVRSLRDDWLIFAELDPFAGLRDQGFPADCPERTVNAGHWYDLTALFTKKFDAVRMEDVLTGEVRAGRDAIRAHYVTELGRLRAMGDALGGAPCLVGECGVPFDLNDAQAYRRWAAGERGQDIWSAQTEALDLMYDALDRLLLSSTQWNYTVSNRNDPMIGDGWNQEDLSIWSADQMTDSSDPDSGGRAVQGFSRPYIRAARGTIVAQSFDVETQRFEASVASDDNAGNTEIVVPEAQYPNGAVLTVDGKRQGDATCDHLIVLPTSKGLVRIAVSPLDLTRHLG